MARRARRTKAQMEAHRQSKRHLSHKASWSRMSAEKKAKILANLARGRAMRADKYPKNAVTI